MLSDAELIQRWRDGDGNAGSKLVGRHFRAVFRFFRSKVGAEADELTQKTFLGCVESRDRFRDDLPFRAYLFGIARKQLLRHFEGRGKGFPADAFSRMSVADLAPSPSRLAAGREEVERLMVAMQRLPVDSQIAIELVHWEGLKLAAVAEVLGVSVGSIKGRMHRAREQLKRELDAATPGSSASFERDAELLGKALDDSSPEH
ncbi:MAG: sigma-70 family RNA polymerase sigma factor [Myxococcota bacterium]